MYVLPFDGEIKLLKTSHCFTLKNISRQRFWAPGAEATCISRSARPVVPLLPAHSLAMIMMIPMCVVGGDAGLWGTGIENVYRGGELLGAYVL